MNPEKITRPLAMLLVSAVVAGSATGCLALSEHSESFAGSPVESVLKYGIPDEGECLDYRGRDGNTLGLCVTADSRDVGNAPFRQRIHFLTIGLTAEDARGADAPGLPVKEEMIAPDGERDVSRYTIVELSPSKGRITGHTDSDALHQHVSRGPPKKTDQENRQKTDREKDKNQ